MGTLLAWMSHNVTLLIPLLTGAAAVWLLMPRLPERQGLRFAGAILGVASLATAGVWLTPPTGNVVHDVMFYTLSAVAVSSAVLMITNYNPVYAALWFALTTLSVCGLFLLRSAPFLAAATVIVYAGAIIVTFLFVIMLAQQHGYSIYDRRATQPLPAVAATFLLLGGVLIAQQSSRHESPAAERPVMSETVAAEANLLSRFEDREPGTMRGLGRSLFGDYLYAVELAGTLLLVACIGAIAIAPRRSRGTL